MFDTSFLPSGGIIIALRFLDFYQTSQFYLCFAQSAILFPKNSPMLRANFLAAVFKESSPVSNDYFLYFLANDENSYPLTYFLVLGTIE